MFVLKIGLRIGKKTCEKRPEQQGIYTFNLLKVKFNIQFLVIFPSVTQIVT